MRITEVSNSAIAMAFGMAVQSKAGTMPPGALAMIADECARRQVLTELLGHLGDDRGRQMMLAISVDRVRARRSG